MKNKNTATVIYGEKEVKDFYLRQKETDLWQRCYTNELVVKGVTNAPIMLEVIKTDMGLEHVPDSAILDCMENQKMAVGFPTDTKMVYYPLRDTGYPSLEVSKGNEARNQINDFTGGLVVLHQQVISSCP